MLANTPLIALGSLTILLLAFVTPRLSFLQIVLISPLILATSILAVIIFLVGTALTYDRAPSPSILYRRRQAILALTFTTPSAWSAVLTRQVWEQDNKSTEQPTHLDVILDLIKHNFILSWYGRVSPSPAFPTAIDTIIRHILSDVTQRSAAVDWPTLVVSKILPRLKDHLKHYRSIEHLASSSARSPNQDLPLPLPSKAHPALSPQSHLPNGSTSPSIEAHLRGILARILEVALPENERSDVVKTAVREITLGAVLTPTFDMLCDSDFWNRQIDDKGGKYLHEQKQVNKFLSALSSLPHPASSPAKSPTTTRAMPPASSISAHSSSRQFDAFIRSITKLKSLGEARRLRADVERELRRARISLTDADARISDKDGERRLRTGQSYVDRLEKARKDIDSRIATLSGVAALPKTPVVASSTPIINLYAVLADPSLLAYWLEHMERRGRARLVQYWLTVEGFKDPLEAAGQDSALESTVLPNDAATLSATSTLAEDAALLREMYFADSSPSIFDIPVKHLKTIRDFSPTNRPLSPSDIREIKYAIFASQKAVYEQMADEDWKDFKKSELYLKTVADLGRSVAPPGIQSPVSDYQVVAPPIHPKRRTTAPVIQAKQLIETPPRLLPSLVGGNFTPASGLAPAASISIAPPIFDRSVSEFRHSSDSRGPIDVTKPLSTPPIPHRAMSQLDFLIGEPIEAERSPLFNDDNLPPDEDDDDSVQIQRMEAIQAALTSIIASDDLASSQTFVRSPDIGRSSPSSSMVLPSRSSEESRRLTSRSVEDLRRVKLTRPVSSTPSSRVTSSTAPPPVVQDRPQSNTQSKPNRLFFDDEVDEEGIDLEDVQEEAHDIVQLAAPGDLRLSAEIARLQDKIQDLVKQEQLLHTLIRQAELTGNQTELKILMRSRSSIRQEQRTSILQKASFEQQEEESRLVPGRTRLIIPSAVMSAEGGDSSKQVVRYTIEVSQLGEDGKPVLNWVVARRYNEFWELDKSLRDWAIGKGDPELLDDLKSRVVELPGKKLVTNLSAGFVEARRLGLERYIQSLVSSAPICDSTILRVFLSQSSIPLSTGDSSSTTPLSSLAPHNIVKTLYKTMADSLDDAGLGPNLLDLMSQTLSRQVVEVAEGFGGFVGINSDDLAGMGISLLPSAFKGGKNPAQWMTGTGPSGSGADNVPATIQPLGGESGLGSFTAPICDLFIELFDLKENNWLRRQAIVIILQQILGGTIERKFRDTFRSMLSAESVDRVLLSFQDTMWPDGFRRPPSEPRSDDEKDQTRARASKKLGLLIPDVAANMIGRGNARRAARRVFGVLQDRRLNQQLMLCLLDEICQALFPEPSP